jgi:hypothetical protein
VRSVGVEEIFRNAGRTEAYFRVFEFIDNAKEEE